MIKHTPEPWVQWDAEIATLKADLAAARAGSDCGAGLTEKCRNPDSVCLTCAYAALRAERDRYREALVKIAVDRPSDEHFPTCDCPSCYAKCVLEGRPVTKHWANPRRTP